MALWGLNYSFFSDAPRLSRLESHVLCMVPAQPLSALQTLKISLRDVVDDPLWLTLAMTPSLEELHCYYPAFQRDVQESSPPGAPTSTSRACTRSVYSDILTTSTLSKDCACQHYALSS